MNSIVLKMYMVHGFYSEKHDRLSKLGKRHISVTFTSKIIVKLLAAPEGDSTYNQKKYKGIKQENKCDMIRWFLVGPKDNIFSVCN